jgi:hypothetical protein
MLDFDFDNLEFDGSMNWGIPLINTDYSIEEILNELGDKNVLSYDAQGDYFFEYAIPQTEYLNADKYNNIENRSEVFNLDCKLPGAVHEFIENNIDIATEDIAIYKATCKSGQFKFDVTSSYIPQEVDNYDVVITSTNVFNADGTPSVVTLSKSNPIKSVPCAGLKLITPDSKIDYIVTITLHFSGNPSVSNVLFKLDAGLIDVKLKDAELEVLKEYEHDYQSATGFSIFTQNINLDLKLHNLKLGLNISNTFGGAANILLSKICLKGDTHTESILKQDNQIITISPNFIGIIDLTPYINSEIVLVSNYDSLVFECTAIIPKGKLSIKDNSAVLAGMNFIVPFDLTIHQAIFQDTLDFALSGLKNLSFIDTVKIRMAFASSMPTDFDVQIWFYNSDKHTVVDSLLLKPMKIKGSFTGTLVPSEAQFIYVTNNKLTALQQTDKVILQLSLNTHGLHKSFNRANKLNARLGARIKIAD